MTSGDRPPQTHAKGQRKALDDEWIRYLRRDDPQNDGAVALADPRFARGLAQYEQGLFYEAHQTWESLWNDLPYPSRLGVHALVKLATAAEHARRRNENGWLAVRAGAIRFLLRFPDSWAGIDARTLRQDIRLWRGGLPPPRILPVA